MSMQRAAAEHKVRCTARSQLMEQPSLSAKQRTHGGLWSGQLLLFGVGREITRHGRTIRTLKKARDLGARWNWNLTR
jgi:hypothetical protein